MDPFWLIMNFNKVDQLIIIFPNLKLFHLLHELIAHVTAVLTSILTGDHILDHLRRSSAAPGLPHVDILPEKQVSNLTMYLESSDHNLVRSNIVPQSVAKEPHHV